MTLTYKADVNCTLQAPSRPRLTLLRWRAPNSFMANTLSCWINRVVGTTLGQLEQKPPAPWMLLVVCFLVGGLRILLELFLQNLKDVHLPLFVHYSQFYIAGFFLYKLWWPRLAQRTWQNLFWIGLIGLSAGVLPPLLDFFWSGPHRAMYTYPINFDVLIFTFGRVATEHGAYEVSFGEGSSVWLVILGITFYTAWRTGSLWRSLVALVAGWASIQVIGFGTFHAVRWLQVFSHPQASTAYQHNGIFVIALSIEALIFFLLGDPHRAKSVAKKAIHILPFAFALLIGGAAVGPLQGAHWTFATLIVILSAIVIVQNDVYDHEEDKAGGYESGLSDSEAIFGYILVLPLLLGAFIVWPVAGTGLFVYYLVWVPYHHPSTRLKAVFPFPYLVEGIAGALCVVIGMSVTANDRVPSLNEPSYGWLVVLALLGFALSSPFKDHKDIKGDQAAGIDTVYVVSLKNGISPARLQWCIFSLVALNHLAVVGCAIYMGAVLWVVTALE